MNKCKMLILLSFVLVVLAGCGDSGDQASSTPGETAPVELTQNEVDLICSNNDFAFDFFKEVNAGTEGNNAFVSPLSLSMLTGMVLNGADDETAQEIEAALGLEGFTGEEINEGYRTIRQYLPNLDPDVKLNLAGSIWHKVSTPKPEFLQTCSDYFDAEVGFLAQSSVDEWVTDVTEGTIDHIDVYPNTCFMMADAIYFKGAWTWAFEDTINTEFHLGNGTAITVPMMTDELEIEMFHLADSHGVRLPYGNGAYSMTIVVPAFPTSVDDFAADFDRVKWEEIQSAMEVMERKVSVPEFELDFQKELNADLRRIGLGSLLAPEGDFSGIYDGFKGFDTIEQYSYVKVDKDGTEASAVTVATAGMSMGDSGFVADRPFLYVIHERGSGAVLFMGKLNDPRG